MERGTNQGGFELLWWVLRRPDLSSNSSLETILEETRASGRPETRPTRSHSLVISGLEVSSLAESLDSRWSVYAALLEAGRASWTRPGRAGPAGHLDRLRVVRRKFQPGPGAAGRGPLFGGRRGRARPASSRGQQPAWRGAARRTQSQSPTAEGRLAGPLAFLRNSGVDVIVILGW